MRGEKAAELFKQGYNCAQAVAVAYCDLTGHTEKQAAMMASSFGGGLGRQREICGAVSGMALVLGILKGYDDPQDQQAKMEHYALVQQLCNKFRAENGSIICRELLNNPDASPNPTPRSPEFYQRRPCERMVYIAAEILEEYLNDSQSK